jgi:hypothetical protein
MLDTVKEQMQLGFKGKVIAFFVLLFIIYGIIWAIIEPLNIEWINEHQIQWRTFLIGFTLIITIVAFIYFFPKKYLERFGLEPTETNLQTTFISTGYPVVQELIDGFQGKVLEFNGNYSSDELDWHLKPSANRAKYASFIYLPNGNLHIYLRVTLTSKRDQQQKNMWIRFEPNFTVADKYNNQIEMAYPVDAINQDNFLKINIDIEKAVRDTYGQGGWQYGKAQLFRIRGSGQLKEVSFR